LRWAQPRWAPVIALLVANKTRVEVAIGETRGELLSLRAPPGTVTTETNPAYKGAAAPAPAAASSPAATDWPSYNKTVSSERFSDLSQINTKNAGKLKSFALTTPDDSRASRPA
jgi:alcohol dehydrogenase (cytochrome c)